MSAADWRIDPDAAGMTWDPPCAECGCPFGEHDAPEFGGGCTRCGDCDGFR